MSRLISVAHLTALDLAPVPFIEAAARAGFGGVGLRLLQVTDTSAAYPVPLGSVALRETQAALRDTGLVVPDIEFVKITPDFDVQALRPILDSGAALGARHLIAAPYDEDLSRLAQNLGALSALSKTFGIVTVLEFFPWTVVPDLASAWRVVQAAGPDTGVLVDSLHFDRSGSTLADLAQIPPERLPFVHLCDAPVHPPYNTQELLHTAREDRLPAGQGAIDLPTLLAGMRADIPVGVEVPMGSFYAKNGPQAVLDLVYSATQRLLSGV
ncbi:Inosose isomerase [Aquimixticola soesokkakensis]|uniref:Inosose isomerase n=1 Tax=Aquimixticola soesokkakensis TaxID=1519096 RepID=A0A1Y5STZ2_9RHOB|nr:TIM barrel protein [Aquimixticola soesokkakensis]SLN48280.1 Inosose isomerase [Aquimixticola soesokkakensis]